MIHLHFKRVSKKLGNVTDRAGGNMTVIHHGKKVRITLDIADSLVNEINEIRRQIGVDRSALIKVWLHERVKQEKAALHSPP